MAKSTVPIDPHDWATSFAVAWIDLADGRADYESLHRDGLVLFRVVGDKAPTEVAQLHFKNTPEPEQLVRDPVGHFTDAATAAGLIEFGDKLDQNIVEFGYKVAELCAGALDHRVTTNDSKPGDYVRSLYGTTRR